MQDGKVVAGPHTGTGTGAIPDDGFCSSAATRPRTRSSALAARRPGHADLRPQGRDRQQMQFAIGSNKPLVQRRRRRCPTASSTRRSPRARRSASRTAARRCSCSSRRWPPDAPCSASRCAQTARDAPRPRRRHRPQPRRRRLDDAGRPRARRDHRDLRNTPSDGQERADPTGVGVFVTTGSGKVDELLVTPEEPRVFPGLRRTLRVEAVDDHQTRRSPAVECGRRCRRRRHRSADATGEVTVDREGRRRRPRTTEVRVLRPLRTLELSSGRLSFADAGRGLAQTVRSGRDGQGYTGPDRAAAT